MASRPTWAFTFNTPHTTTRQKPAKQSQLATNFTPQAIIQQPQILVRHFGYRSVGRLREGLLRTEMNWLRIRSSHLALHDPPFENDREWIAMVNHMKATMAPEVRQASAQGSIVGEICRLCCTPYTEAHSPWVMSCCNAVCGRLCIAIALYDDGSHQCPFCFFQFLQTPDPQTPIYEIDEQFLAKWRTLVEKSWTFAQSSNEFSVADLEMGMVYNGKTIRDWTGMDVAPAAAVDSQTKESFTVADLEPAHQPGHYVVSLGTRVAA